MTGHNRNVRSTTWLVWVIVPAALLLLAGANAHLLYVAVQSDPECVAHSKIAGVGQDYIAAKPAC